MAITYTQLPISCLADDKAKALHDAAIKKYKVDGLCCSWAMDWVKKMLKKPQKLTATTYEDKSRIKKIAQRHRLQNKQGQAGVADAYGLRLNTTEAYWEYLDEFGDRTVRGNLAAGKYYYLSCSARVDTDEGRKEVAHGIAVHTGSPIILADSYSGVYQCRGGEAVEVAQDHFSGVFKL
jgi:hypothetical protein